MGTIKDSLERSHADRFRGRERELARLATLFEPRGPIVVLLHGVGGIGKTSLVRAFERESAARGRRVRLLDCRGVEPVPPGLLGAIGTSLGVELRNVSEAAAVIGALAEPMVLALDNYEALRLLDGWLRTELLPALPISARFIIMGRSLATAPWIAAPGWADHVLSLRLGPLEEADVAAFLASRGFTEAARERIARFSRGNPLALQLCTASLAEKPDALTGDLELNQVNRSPGAHVRKRNSRPHAEGSDRSRISRSPRYQTCSRSDAAGPFRREHSGESATAFFRRGGGRRACVPRCFSPGN
jgi:hypothetical protein